MRCPGSRSRAGPGSCAPHVLHTRRIRKPQIRLRDVYTYVCCFALHCSKRNTLPDWLGSVSTQRSRQHPNCLLCVLHFIVSPYTHISPTRDRAPYKQPYTTFTFACRLSSLLCRFSVDGVARCCRNLLTACKFIVAHTSAYCRLVVGSSSRVAE